ncbi:MAG TPA: chromate efflux transporter, partial [Phototrophicaceae bacterium]|nr:chromate efflux transporter [Phototrophicaceae bacterium]
MTDSDNDSVFAQESAPPRESYSRLFLRFLRFGFMAWGGPVAQIAMIRQELVEEEKWISRERFNRILAVYQILPGPEAQELCVYFGFLARGRLGGILGGLGFMLPGFVLMMLLSWLYVTYGITSPLLIAAFAGMQAAVGALIVRAVHRIGNHVLHDRWTWAIAAIAALAQLAGINFLVILLVAGVTYFLVERGGTTFAAGILTISLIGIIITGYQLLAGNSTGLESIVNTTQGQTTIPALFGSGLRSGLLTFGGAYTVIPYLRHDAVIVGNWMTGSQFLDGLALSGILPAPLVIFGTFVGYLGSGFAGGVALTAGIFLPAFAFTLIGHQYVERL